MPLDYSNLPLLLTIDEIAELFRCSPGTIRRKMKDDPAWLRPERHGLMRRKLYATVDVMAKLGHAAPAAAAAPLQGVVDSWSPAVADDVLDQAARQKKWEQAERRHQKYLTQREAWEERVRRHKPSARLRKAVWHEGKARGEVSDDGESFRITLRFQPRFRPDGWPALIPIPRGGPEWIRLETDAEMHAIIAEIDEVMAEYQPLWDRKVDDTRRAREAGRA